ncbi:Espin protein [Spatholobus suberectus]|nr:Espin protein [Spatholobus suberectus]
MDAIPLFSEKMKLAQKAATAIRWEDFKKIMKDDKENLLKWLDLFGNNAIHVATRSNNPQLLKELIEVLPKEGRWQAMCKENREGNTILHEVVFCENVQMADVVFDLEEELQPQSPEVKRSLLEHENRRGEAPLFMAAMHGKLKMLKHMAKHIAKHNMGDIRKYLHRSYKCSALHASVIEQHFDVAIWLVRMDKELAMEKDEKESTCLQLLSKMPQRGILESSSLAIPSWVVWLRICPLLLACRQLVIGCFEGAHGGEVCYDGKVVTTFGLRNENKSEVPKVVAEVVVM